jgi:rSAM/selenodomain-associated transferase 1
MIVPRPDRAVVVLGRLPRPGQVKTRLIPALGEALATALYEAMLGEVLAQAEEAARRAEATLYFACDTLGEPLHQARRYTKEAIILPQPTGDLAVRLLDAARATQAEAVVLLGSDAPQLSAERITEALVRLPAGGATVIPAVDGGYVALGMQGVLQELFYEIPWSTSAVLATTLARAEAAQVPILSLGPAVEDLDEPADLAAVLAALPATARCRPLFEEALLAVRADGV